KTPSGSSRAKRRRGGRTAGGFGTGCAGWIEPDAADFGRGKHVHYGRRDFRSVTRRLRRVPGDRVTLRRRFFLVNNPFSASFYANGRAILAREFSLRKTS